MDFIPEEYKTYLASEQWKRFRDAYFAKYPKRCKVGTSKCTGAIHLHHLEYGGGTKQPFTDFIPLCSYHHSDLTRRWRALRKPRPISLRTFTYQYINRTRLNKG